MNAAGAGARHCRFSAPRPSNRRGSFVQKSSRIFLLDVGLDRTVFSVAFCATGSIMHASQRSVRCAMSRRCAAVCVMLVLMVGTAAAQDARSVLQAASTAMGTATLKTVQITGTGWNAAMGQSFSPEADWPRFEVTDREHTNDRLRRAVVERADHAPSRDLFRSGRGWHTNPGRAAAALPRERQFRLELAGHDGGSSGGSGGDATTGHHHDARTGS